MKNKFLKIEFGIAILIAIFLIFFSSANLVNAQSTGQSVNCKPVIQLVNQDPNPAVPNEYVKVLFAISNINSDQCNGLSVRLQPEYPFSLDPGTNPTQTLTGNTFNSQNYASVWNVPYKVRVANDALQGDYTLKLLYTTGVDPNFTSGIEEDFNLSLTDSQTDFSVVVQDTSGTQASLGIVNIGTNTANSLIVSIPPQNNFVASGVSQQIVGNLAAGDYTIVSFSVVPRNQAAGGRTARNATTMNQSFNFGAQSLNVQLDYTDGIGKRRSVIREVQLSGTSATAGNFTRGNFSRSSSNTASSSSMWVYVVGVIILVIAVIIFSKKYAKKDSNRIKKNSEKTPDWVSSEKTRKKK